jgi:hypothetical protein
VVAHQVGGAIAGTPLSQGLRDRSKRGSFRRLGGGAELRPDRHVRSRHDTVVSTVDEAVAVKACLRKRVSAPRRIGVAYRLRSAVQSEAWRQPDLEKRLCIWFPRSGEALPCRHLT